ncbi:hypothetical protein COX00_02855 [Candidatus Uhrbacteria bacterium CG22_combo_CG10-13_8_21_14_all_47_17]|uniref:AI-2E family transporter n=1 Tax=Candidatus Uhrbacteria bacterium CG22_combo_CG10-13_8_21_14_all_47_17 TaxID=1975041 RepID=A0A2H0BS78_9BACT|nr:MAG: hypothetical protein COX00_02855 [Candidatus Uhrbacteria bacterium CG22_combo_CG10-13_8_21_14_all_47_17]
MSQKQLQLYFFTGFYLVILVLAFLIFRPFVPVLALAGMFAVILQPVQDRLSTLFRGRLPGFASVLAIVLLILLFLVPIGFIGTQVFQETSTLYTYVTTNGKDVTTLVNDVITKPVQQYVPGFSIDVDTYARQALSWLIGNLGQIFSGTLQTVLGFFIGLVALYYFLKDGRGFLQSIAELSPLPNRYDIQVQERLTLAINSIVKGTLLIALIQGILSGIGYSMFGLPNPALWGTLAAIGALVPGVGTTIVLVPAVTYLVITGHYFPAFGLAIWGMTAVGLIDNILGPSLVGHGVKIHPLFILFSVLGGIVFFGPTGFLLGPLILSLLYALTDIYRLLILKQPLAKIEKED